MPGLDGLGVVRRLREQNIEPPHVIFSTAYEQFAVEAFRLDAMDYLLKPVERLRLEETIGRARRVVADRITDPPPPFRAPTRVHEMLVRNGTRNLIVDRQDLIYATIDNGVITWRRRSSKASRTSGRSKNCSPRWTRTSSGAPTGLT